MSSVIHPLGFYVLRLPLLPISDLWRLHACATLPALAGAIQVLYQREEIQDAIYLASPELHQEMMKWLGQPTAARSADDERLVLTLYKYLLRMSSRCTPYGLFAGFATGTIGAAPTCWELAPAEGRRASYARLDMNYVAELSKQLTADPSLKTQLTFTVNNSLYKLHDSYRYYESRTRNKQRSYYLVSVKSSAYLEQVLAAAKAGVSYDTLRSLLEASGIAAAAAAGYLDRLIAAQVLLSELEPTVTGREFFHCLVDRLEQLAPEHPQLPPLRRISVLLATNAGGVAASQAVQDLIRQALPQASSRDLIQNDLRLNMAHNNLNQAAVAHLSQDLGALAGLYQAAAPVELKAFAMAFYQRYEEQEIPLLEALDGEAGVGYGATRGSRANYTPLVEDVRVPGAAGASTVAWTAYRQLVFRKFQESQRNGQAVVVLTDEDLRSLAGPNPAKVPSALFALGNLSAPNTQALDQGDFRFYLTGCYGPGALTLLARFGHADPALAEQLRAGAQREQQAHGEALLAEVVHLPEARVGSIVQRPQLRDYEIPFLGNASVPADRQIPVADLLVSVRGGRVLLRSRRLNKLVIPRLTAAHNYSGGLPVYRFLCDLQQQHEAFAITWDWGVLHTQSYLPRVEYGRIVLSRARWQLPATAYAAAADCRTSAQVARFRQQYQLPAQVLLVEADNELLLDFACPLALSLLVQQLKKGPVLLCEFGHGDQTPLVTDEHQTTYVSELIIPFVGPAPVLAPAAVAAPAGALRRVFALGSEWTYLKVYCGTKWADKILVDYLRPCLEDFEQQGHISQWFFVRYADPEPHLRLRLRHAPDPATIAVLIGQLHRALAGLQQERVVRDVQYDTYRREMERYGAATMEFSEAVFHHDSQAVLSFLDLIEGEEGERYRWLFAVRGVDALLDDFGLSLAEKAAVAEQARQGFFREFRGNAALTRQLNDKYRAVGRQLATFLNPDYDPAEIQEAVAVFGRRSAGIGAACDELRGILGPNVAARLRPLLPSYLHMFLNRMFTANQRLHELVVYHYLTKHYTSLVARERQLEPVAR